MLYVRVTVTSTIGTFWATGWSHDEVLPYFKKSEDYEGGISDYHGVGEPLCSECPNPTPVAMPCGCSS